MAAWEDQVFWKDLLEAAIEKVAAKLNNKQAGAQSSASKQGTTSSPPQGKSEDGLGKLLSDLLSKLNQQSGAVASSPTPQSTSQSTPSNLTGGQSSPFNPPLPPQQQVPQPSSALQQVLASLQNQMARQGNQKVTAPAAGGVPPLVPPSGGPPVGTGGQPPQPPQQPPPSSPPPPPQEPEWLKGLMKFLREPVTSTLNFARGGIEAIAGAAEDPSETIRQGKKKGGIGGRLQAAGGYGLRALQQDRELQGVGDLAGGAGELAGMVPVLGKPTQAFLKLTEVVIKSIDRLKMWTENVHEGNMRFAQFSSSMFAVQQQAEARRIMREQQIGEELAPSAKKAAEGMDKLEASLVPIKNVFGKVKNEISAFLGGNLGGAISKVTGGEIQQPGGALWDWASDIGEETWFNTYGRPAEFNFGPIKIKGRTVPYNPYRN